MLSLLDIAERSQTGPKMAEADWDMGLFGKMTELARRYDLCVPQDIHWFNMDAGLAQRAFQAGLDFLVEMGVYCLSTGRIVQFTRDEVLTAIREAPQRVEMGQGADRRAFVQQRVEGQNLLNVCPGHHAPFTVDLAPLVVESFARMPRADFLEGFNFTTVDQREIYGLPMEAYAVRRQMDYLRAGIQKAGRPGLAIVLYPINTRVGALLCALDPEHGLRPTDGMLLSVLPDCKMEHDLLTAAIVGHEYGLFTLSGSFSLVGGFCGGVEGAIIEGVVKPLVAMLVYRDYISYVGVEHSRGVSLQEMVLQPVSWARSLVFQALNTFTHTIAMAWIIPTAGPGTETNLIEVAIRSIEAQINGGNLYAVRHSRAQMNAGQTPLEAEWMVEVADATLRARLDRESAGRICRALADKLKGRQPEPGHTIQECYDLLHHRPLPAYERIYGQLKGELAALGLDFG
jgi:methylamine---corrinoid protein Co-methyltransferase